MTGDKGQEEGDRGQRTEKEKDRKNENEKEIEEKKEKQKQKKKDKEKEKEEKEKEKKKKEKKKEKEEKDRKAQPRLSCAPKPPPYLDFPHYQLVTVFAEDRVEKQKDNQTTALLLFVWLSFQSSTRFTRK